MLLCAVDQQRHLAADAWLHAYKCELHLFTALMLPNLRAVMLKILQITSSCHVMPGQPKN